jgi:hypothetical protein
MMDTRALAGRLGMSEQAIRAWRLKGFGPRFVRFGRTIRYSVDDVETWIASNTCTSTSGAAGVAA